MDSIYNPGSAANHYLEPFGMQIGTSIYQRPNDVNSQLDTTVTLSAEAAMPTLAIAGGASLFVTDQGHTFVSFKYHGRGAVVVVVDAVMFSRQFMGCPEDELAEDDGRRKIYESAHAIFEDCLFGHPVVTRRTSAARVEEPESAGGNDAMPEQPETNGAVADPILSELSKSQR